MKKINNFNHKNMMKRKKKAKEKGEVFGATSQTMMIISSKFKLVIIPSKLREVNILIYDIYFN